MKKLALPLAAIALALSLGNLTRPAAAQAQSRPSWEHRVMRLEPSEYTDKADYKQILQREGPRKVDAAFREHVLNHMGKDGWQLVQVEQRSKNLTYLYLKRQKP